MNKLRKLFFTHIFAVAGWLSFLIWFSFFYFKDELSRDEFGRYDPFQETLCDSVFMNGFSQNLKFLFVILSLLLLEILIRKFFIKSKNKIENNDKTSSVFIKVLSNSYNIFLIIGLFFGLLPICILVFPVSF